MYQSLLSLSAMIEVLIQSDVEQIKSDGGKENNAKMLRKSSRSTPEVILLFTMSNCYQGQKCFGDREGALLRIRKSESSPERFYRKNVA